MGILVVSFFLAYPSRVSAQSEDSGEYRVKLAFLYNFAQFIDWPPETFRDPSAPLLICVAGPNPFEGDLEHGLRNRRVAGHSIAIKRLGSNDDPRACQMIFVRASEKKTAARVLAAVSRSNTLTVGESNDFSDLGGIINLTLHANKLRFEINLDAATQTQLKISSKLLALAKIVKVGDSH